MVIEVAKKKKQKIYLSFCYAKPQNCYVKVQPTSDSTSVSCAFIYGRYLKKKQNPTTTARASDFSYLQFYE